MFKPDLYKCPDCLTEIYSRWPGDFVSCKCGACYVDQTNEYIRLGGVGIEHLGSVPESYIEANHKDVETLLNNEINRVNLKIMENYKDFGKTTLKTEPIKKLVKARVAFNLTEKQSKKKYKEKLDKLKNVTIPQEILFAINRAIQNEEYKIAINSKLVTEEIEDALIYYYDYHVRTDSWTGLTIISWGTISSV